jgi:cell division FtsZ-interacting protein ZapD
MFTEEEKLYALRTVQRFRDRWEALEQENLQSDISKKLERAEYDRVYKEHYEALDQTELDRIVEDAILNAQPGEGEEAISNGEKAMIGHKSRFLRMVTTFYAPN